MVSESGNSNLNNYINNLKDKLSNGDNFTTIVESILSVARDNELTIREFNGSIYIEKGLKPSAILHLNIDSLGKIPFCFKSLKDRDAIISKSDINLIAGSIVVNYLINYTDLDFDLLITSNNIQSELEDYRSLRNLIRTDKVINLNLKQDDSLADEFSSLLLYVLRVPVKRFVPDFEYNTYRLSISNLIGGHAGDISNKLRMNSIKMSIGIFRRMKSKVDLDMVSFTAGDRYDNIPASASIDFIINSDYDNELINIFEIFKNDTIEKNLRYEPDMKLSLEKIETKDIDPITSESFSKLASFVELCPTGTFSVNSIDNQVISSVNLATARPLEEHISMVLVLRSLSQESMDQMLEKSKIAADISDSDFINKLKIPKWKNKDDSLRKVFEKSYLDLFEKPLDVVKTQYSLDSSIVFDNLNVNIVSLGVKYKQDDEYFLSYISDIDKLIKLLENVLNRIKTNEESL